MIYLICLLLVLFFNEQNYNIFLIRALYDHFFIYLCPIENNLRDFLG